MRGEEGGRRGENGCGCRGNLLLNDMFRQATYLAVWLVGQIDIHTDSWEGERGGEEEEGRRMLFGNSSDQ